MKRKICLLFVLFILNAFIFPGYLAGCIASPKYHIVRRGDTLYRISKLYGVSVEEIRKRNHLSPDDKIYPGQRLIIPQVGGVYHQVKEHQTLWRIAKTYYGGVTAEEIKRDVEKIMRANGLSSPEIKVGQKLFIPGATKVMEVEVPSELWSKEEAGPDEVESSQERREEKELAEIKSDLCWPVKGEIIRYFEKGKFNGIDIAAPEGATIVAPADGEVYWEGLLSTYGRTLILYHKKEDLYTCYMHISVYLVRKGDQVKKGQPIARVGATGNVDLPCLHFEIRKGIDPVNPLDYLP